MPKISITATSCENLKTLANDTYKVTSSVGEFALKLYNPQSRTAQDVARELELIDDLLQQGVPTAKPVEGAAGQLQEFIIDGIARPSVLFGCLRGEKTKGSHEN